MTKRLAVAMLLLSFSVCAAEFQNGQAARAVIGQSSFSSREPGIIAHALSAAKNRLYVAEANNHLLTFDTSRLAFAKDGSACPVCGLAPSAVTNQVVFQGIAASAVFGRSVVIANSRTHQVMIWRGANSGSSPGPDVVLGGATSAPAITASSIVDPTSVAYDGKRLFVGDAALHRVLIWNSLPTSDDQPADAVLGQADFSTTNAANTPEAGSIRTPAALASDGTNLFVADAGERRVLVFTPGDVALMNDAVVNAASLMPGPVAPGTLIAINGDGLAETAESAQDNGADHLPNRLGGVQVLLNGNSIPLLSTSSEQVQAQVPYDLGGATAGSLVVRMEHANGTVSLSNAVALKVAPASPGIYAFGGTEPRSGLVLHAPFDSGETQAGAPVTAEDPARSGETIILWAAGLGVVANANKVTSGAAYDGPDADVLIPVSAFVNGQIAAVVSAKLPQGAIGVYEVRVLLPSNFAADDSAQLSLSQNGLVSNSILVPVQSSIR